MNTRSGAEGYQRQLYYGGANYGGYPTFYNNPYNPYPYVDQSVGNQFTGRYSSGEPAYQQYTTDSVTYQFIPTSITPIQQQQQAPVQNNVKFVPCMCPVAVSMSPPIPEKRSDEIPTGPVVSQPSQSLVSETEGQPMSSSMKTLDEIELEESKWKQMKGSENKNWNWNVLRYLRNKSEYFFFKFRYSNFNFFTISFYWLIIVMCCKLQREVRKKANHVWEKSAHWKMFATMSPGQVHTWLAYTCTVNFLEFVT